MAIGLVVAVCTRMLVRVDMISVCPAVFAATFTACAPEVTVRFFDHIACRVQVFVGILANFASPVAVVALPSSSSSTIVLIASTASSVVRNGTTKNDVGLQGGELCSEGCQVSIGDRELRHEALNRFRLG